MINWLNKFYFEQNNIPKYKKLINTLIWFNHLYQQFHYLEQIKKKKKTKFLIF